MRLQLLAFDETIPCWEASVMADAPEVPADWTASERWVWQRIAAGKPADFNRRDREYYSDFEDLNPCKEEGWAESRRLRAAFLQTILTQKAFADATPFGGARILGALVEDAPLDLKFARLQKLFWLERSRILVDVEGRGLRVDGGLSLEGGYVAGQVELFGAGIREGLSISSATLKGELDLESAGIRHYLNMQGSTFEQKVNLNADIGSHLDMHGSTFYQKVNLNGARVGGGAMLCERAVFRGELDLTSANIGRQLIMRGATFEQKVSLNGARVGDVALLSECAVFKDELDLTSFDIGGELHMEGSTFEQRVNLNGARVGGVAFLSERAVFKDELDLTSFDIGGELHMEGSTFEQRINLNGAKVGGTAFLSQGAVFSGEVVLRYANFGSNLDFGGAIFRGQVDLTGCNVVGELRLGSSGHRKACWGDRAKLILRNTHVGALQDWWRDAHDNSWPDVLELEGFTYDRLGGLHGEGKEADMTTRPSESYKAWLGKDSSFSPQPYEQLARAFREAGEPRKATDILYGAREQQRRAALSTVDGRGQPKQRDWSLGLGLWALRLTIGYGLGHRYFRALWWVLGLTLLSMLLLVAIGGHSVAQWPLLFFASLDQLLPVITLNKAHETLIFGHPWAKPPYALLAYFYVLKMAGWVLGSFIVAGLAGLTQRN
jgi:uncharacterized protein YjbI with pentapeptide repeats